MEWWRKSPPNYTLLSLACVNGLVARLTVVCRQCQLYGYEQENVPLNDREEPPTEVLTALLGEQDTLSAKKVTGGLSGATVWRIAQKYALRHWPKALADPSRIERTAQVLRHAHAHGAPFVPQPISPAFQASDGDWWEATTWCPGTPLLETDPTPRRIQAATETLAKFHHAVSEFSAGKGPSPAIQQRIEALESCVDRTPSQQAIPDEWCAVAQRLARCLPILEKIAQPLVRRYAEVILPLQPVQIDSRPEHFLFVTDGDAGGDDTVTGLIDFGAMRVDTRAVDVARLTGELAQGEDDRRDNFVQQYNACTREPVDVKLVKALDVSGAVLAAANWLNWLADGKVAHRDPATIRQRLENLAKRAERLAADS